MYTHMQGKFLNLSCLEISSESIAKLNFSIPYLYGTKRKTWPKIGTIEIVDHNTKSLK